MRCSYNCRRKWKKNDNEKNVIKAKMSYRIDATRKQTLVTFFGWLCYAIVCK